MIKTKKSALALSVAFAATLAGGLFAMNKMPATAVTSAVERGYYGRRMSDSAAGAFYEAFVAMDFSAEPTGDGETVSNKNKTVSDLAKEYEKGDNSILRAFATAADAFSFDRSDLFYVDFRALDVWIAKNHTVTIGKGKSSYLRAGITRAETGELECVSTYNTKIEEFNTSVGDKLPAKGEGASYTVKEKAQAVISAISALSISNVYEASSPSDAARTFADTAYGALTYKVADSEGYARLFNEAMTKLGEESIVVSGYYVRPAGGGKDVAILPWTWNYVKNDNEWFAVDVANYCTSSSNDFLMATGESFFLTHYEESRVSAASYGLAYPSLATRDIKVETPAPKLSFGGSGDILVSYDGKNLASLPSGKAAKIRLMGEDNAWGNWQTFDEVTGLSADNSANNVTCITGLNPSQKYEIGIFEGADWLECGNGSDGVRSAFVFPTIGSSDIRKTLQDSAKSHHISISYTDALTQISPEGGEEGEGGSSEVQTPSSFIKEKDGKGTIIKSSWDGDKTVEFDFKPDSSALDNGVYEFVLENLECGDKKIKPYVVHFRAPSVNVSRISTDTRIYLEKTQSVSLGNNTNLDFGTDWAYAGGGGSGGGFLSGKGNVQLLLHVDEVSSEEQKTASNSLTTAAEGEQPIVKKELFKAAAMHSLTLTVNGGAVNIPASTDLKLTFAYPKDYPFGTDGISFKVYSWDGSAATPLNCAATAYGIVTSVKALSPNSKFIVVAAKTENVEGVKAPKYIITQVSGKGNVVAELGGVQTKSSVNCLKDGELIKYTIEEPAGYKLEYVVLNGTEMEVTRPTAEEGGTPEKPFVTVDSASELFKNLPENSVLQFGFVDAAIEDESIEEAAAKALIDKQFTPIIEPVEKIPVIDSKSTKTQLIILAAVVGGIVVIGSFVMIYGVAIRPRILKEKEEEEERLANMREKRANRNRMSAGMPPHSNGSDYPHNYPKR